MRKQSFTCRSIDLIPTITSFLVELQYQYSLFGVDTYIFSHWKPRSLWPLHGSTEHYGTDQGLKQVFGDRIRRITYICSYVEVTVSCRHYEPITWCETLCNSRSIFVQVLEETTSLTSLIIWSEWKCPTSVTSRHQSASEETEENKKSLKIVTYVCSVLKYL